MPERYRFIRFPVNVTLRVPWSPGVDPELHAEHFRNQVLHQYTNPDAMQVWSIARPGPARSYNLADDLPKERDR